MSKENVIPSPPWVALRWDDSMTPNIPMVPAWCAAICAGLASGGAFTYTSKEPAESSVPRTFSIFR